jgi:hypothetical protein
MLRAVLDTTNKAMHFKQGSSHIFNTVFAAAQTVQLFNNPRDKTQFETKDKAPFWGQGYRRVSTQQQSILHLHGVSAATAD